MFPFPFQTSLRFAPDLEEFERLPAASVFKIIAQEGRRELRRPAASLWWSAVAAGFAMVASVIGVAVLAKAAPAEAPWRGLFIALGYPFGFVLVILSRLQLFTENTVTPILPLLLRPSRRAWLRTGRLWGIVFAGNLFGAAAAAAMAVGGGMVGETLQATMTAVSLEALDHTPTESFSQGILAGFLIAALVWMLPNTRGQELLAVFSVTYLIGAAGAPHVIAGAVETFVAIFSGEMGLLAGLVGHVAPTLAGNVAGGTILFALLAYGQVWRELQEGKAPLNSGKSKAPPSTLEAEDRPASG